jgi:hypothetical protein
MDAKWLIDPERIRKIDGSFSWIDQRFISGRFIHDLSREEILIYLFLVAASDRQGLSFYHDDRICSLLKIDLAALGEARQLLSERSLLAWRPPVYQVLSLPAQPVTPPSPEERLLRQRQRSLAYIKKIQEVIA